MANIVGEDDHLGQKTCSAEREFDLSADRHAFRAERLCGKVPEATQSHWDCVASRTLPKGTTCIVFSQTNKAPEMQFCRYEHHIGYSQSLRTTSIIFSKNAVVSTSKNNRWQVVQALQ